MSRHLQPQITPDRKSQLCPFSLCGSWGVYLISYHLKIGDELEVIFTVESEELGCSFTSPRGKTYNLLRGNADENGRIQQIEKSKNDCGMRINHTIKNFDDGEWRSNITYRGEFFLQKWNSQLCYIFYSQEDLDIVFILFVIWLVSL